MLECLEVPVLAESENPPGVTLIDLTKFTCRWPIGGDPRSPEEFKYCGAIADTGRPYCAHHRSLARQSDS